VTTNPGSLSATDIDTVASFAEAGGRTLIASDPGTAGALTELGSTAGIYGEAGYVYDMTNNDANYLSVLVESSGSSVLTNDVDEVVFRGAARVGAASGSEPLTTAETAQLSTTREAGTYGVAVRSGSVAAVGDSSFLAPENAYHADNNVLIGNLGDFLVTGENRMCHSVPLAVQVLRAGPRRHPQGQPTRADPRPRLIRRQTRRPAGRIGRIADGETAVTFPAFTPGLPVLQMGSCLNSRKSCMNNLVRWARRYSECRLERHVAGTEECS